MRRIETRIMNFGDGCARAASFLIFCAALLVAPGASAAPKETALDRYIATPDDVYAWRVEKTLQGEGFKAFVLELTSQTWRKAEEVDRPVWKHWLTVYRPEGVTSNRAFLQIGGGNNKSGPPDKASDRFGPFAVATKTVVAELGQVPNQPLSFWDSKDEARSEDDLIAYSRVKYIETKDEFWLVRLAMVKSAVRAMTAVQEFMASEEGGKVAIEKFTVSGGSKRGWTTWLTAVQDPRVEAIIPIVIDALNSEKITQHHYEAYGFFSPALDDYVKHKLFPDKVGTPEYREILSIEDPFEYRERPRLFIPKFVMNAAGDEFFLPDNSQFYFSKMLGPKYLRYVPNAKHNLADTDARQSVQAFYEAIINGRELPEYSWKKRNDGSILVKTKTQPIEVVMWQAVNPDARDFRLDTIGKAYRPSPLKEDRPGAYLGRVATPEKGFTAFFIELTYDSGGPIPHKFTTEVSVVPDVLPFKMPKTLPPK